MGNPKVEKLISDLQAESVQQRRAASYKLGKFKDPLAVPALIQACKDSDGSVRQNAVHGLQKIGTKEAVDFLSSKGIPPAVSRSAPNVGAVFLSFAGWSIISLAGNLFLLSLFDNLYQAEGRVIAVMLAFQITGYGFATFAMRKNKRPIGLGILVASIPYLIGFFLRSGCIPPGLPFPISLISGC